MIITFHTRTAWSGEPFGTATVHVREGAKPGLVSGSIVITEAEIEAARKGRTVVRQGAFTGARRWCRDRD